MAYEFAFQKSLSEKFQSPFNNEEKVKFRNMPTYEPRSFPVSDLKQTFYILCNINKNPTLNVLFSFPRNHSLIRTNLK